MNPFVSGVEYRREDLLAFVGSKQAQSGVLWGVLEPGCLICTSGGRHGKKAGYSDQPLRDGRWHYFGQGQAGDQSLSNPANAKLANGERSILLFTSREPSAREIAASGRYGKLFAFCGSFNVSAVETVVPDSGPRKGDRLLRFLLLPVGDGAGPVSNIVGETDQLPTDLRTLQGLLARSTVTPLETGISLVEYRRRSALVHRYAMLRAAGCCEACLRPAPFLDQDGHLFLEVHHILRLADDGVDAPANVAAICPNCHRAVHHGKERHALGQRIARHVAEVERQVSCGAFETGTLVVPSSAAGGLVP